MIKDTVVGLYESMSGDPHHRYKSWEHCYKFFRNRPDNYDHASLHLGFYLASWGMYRGSSFLLQKDYLVHVPVVKEILNSSHDHLRDLSIVDLLEDQNSQKLNALFDLIDSIKDFYKRYPSDTRSEINVTDTLATKILLGTLGCVPAYDRFFIRGMKEVDLTYSYLNKVNFIKMIEFCNKNRSQFEQAQQEISSQGTHYPIMKIIDMYFWSLGMAKDKDVDNI